MFQRGADRDSTDHTQSRTQECKSTRLVAKMPLKIPGVVHCLKPTHVVVEAGPKFAPKNSASDLERPKGQKEPHFQQAQKWVKARFLAQNTVPGPPHKPIRSAWSTRRWRHSRNRTKVKSTRKPAKLVKWSFLKHRFRRVCSEVRGNRF